MGLQELAKGWSALQWGKCWLLPCFLLTTVPVHSLAAQPLQSYAIPIPQHYSLFQRPSFSFSLSITLFLTEFFPTHCSSTVYSLTLLPADFLLLLCPLPFTATVSALLYWARGLERRVAKKPFSPVSLFFSPVQGLSLHSRGESEYLPHSLPHEEVLLGMV